MMDKPSLKLTLDILGLHRPQIREMNRLCIANSTLRKHPRTMSIFKNDLLCTLLNELGEATYLIVFNCKAGDTLLRDILI